MDWLHATPKIIYSLWLQGEKHAPDIVRLCFDRWATFNPNYEFRILDSHDVGRLLEGLDIPVDSMTPQALSDVVRARLLLETGGVWVDSSLFPTQALDEWLPGMLQSTGFFAFERPGHDRPISSWFLAAARDHIIINRWWEQIGRFWSKPRRLAMYEAGPVPSDPVESVAPGRGAATDEFPYYWFHYLFQYLIENDADIADVWSHTAKCSASPPHCLQELFAESGRPSRDQIIAAASCAPVQKLQWRTNYPLDVLATLNHRQKLRFLPMTTQSSKQAAILVLGMHRSGTSALARLINVLGAELPEELYPPEHGNPLGHWESLHLLKLNDEMLAFIGRDSADPRPIPRQWFRSRAAYLFQKRLGNTIASAHGDAPLILIKDPRICRLAPLYLEALDSIGIEPLIIIPIRHPAEVIRSFEERNEIDPLTVELVWLRHLLEAEEATRACPRVWTSYDHLLENWETTAQSIAQGLGVIWPNTLEKVAAEVPKFLRSRHRHYNVAYDPTPPALGPLTLRVWQAAQLGFEGDETAARALFDEIRAGVTELDRLSLPQQERMNQRLAAAETAQQLGDTKSRQLQVDLTRTQAELCARTNERDQLRRQIDSVHASICWRITWPIRWLHQEVKRVIGALSKVHLR
jgi:hypothetical protein